ncbi:hypothetical protein [Variovorax boronicumulans]|uniref:hypothetical protein n=1 Tax=Variovorax boronicumulans TaxID=436515 RepID=UPI001C56417D
MTANLFQRLQELLGSDARLAGDVAVAEATGMAVVTLPGGGQLRVNNPLGLASGARVYVQGGAITGPAPDLPFVEIEIS